MARALLKALNSPAQEEPLNRLTTWPAKASVGALTVALALTWTVPAGAAEAKAVQPQTPLAVATSAHLAKLDKATAAAATQSAAPAAAETSSQPFLKSPKGIAVILLMVAGTGYAIYSANNQRISNPLR